MEGEARVAGAVAGEGCFGWGGGLLSGGVRGVDVDDDELKGGVAALGELELDVFVEEVEEGRRGYSEREAQQVAAGAGGRAAGGGRRRASLPAEEADLLDAFGGDEFGEAVAGVLYKCSVQV